MLTLSQHIDQILGILLALFLSSLIGLERQARGKALVFVLMRLSV